MNQLIFAYDSGEERVLNMGPHHPSTHGVIRFIIKTDGEIMREAIPDVGYLHRSIEKIAEGIPYESLMPYTDRVDYVSAMTADHCWALAVEKLLKSGLVDVGAGSGSSPWAFSSARLDSAL